MVLSRLRRTLLSCVCERELVTLSSQAIDSGWLELPFSLCILGSRNHLHGFGDFLDVLDGLEADGHWGRGPETEPPHITRPHVTHRRQLTYTPSA